MIFDERVKRYRFCPGARDIHMFFGWLEIGEIWRDPQKARVPRWALEHPHVGQAYGTNSNVIYAAGGNRSAGIFQAFDSSLVLTADRVNGIANLRRSYWRLPHWFSRHLDAPLLGLHNDPNRWSLDGDDVILKTVGRGQEFVLDCEHYPEAKRWLDELLDWNKRQIL